MFTYEIWLSNTLGYFELGIRLLAACLCGIVVGYERTKRQKEAGLRTHMLVTLGACLIMIVSRYAFISFAGDYDPSRIASNVITGISFLGAGVIFVRGSSVKGLTTAAGIWTTAGIGLAIGAGLYTIGIFVTVIMVIVQFVLHQYYTGDVLSYGEITITVPENDTVTIPEIRAILREMKVTVTELKMSRETPGFSDFVLEIRVPSSDVSDKLIALSQKFGCIRTISI